MVVRMTVFPSGLFMAATILLGCGGLPFTDSDGGTGRTASDGGTGHADASNVGAPCDDLMPNAGPKQGVYNSEALECTSRICIKPIDQTGVADTRALCSAMCSADSDCVGRLRNTSDPTDKTCVTGFTCGVIFTKGNICCSKLCVCMDKGVEARDPVSHISRTEAELQRPDLMAESTCHAGGKLRKGRGENRWTTTPVSVRRLAISLPASFSAGLAAGQLSPFLRLAVCSGSLRPTSPENLHLLVGFMLGLSDIESKVAFQRTIPLPVARHLSVFVNHAQVFVEPEIWPELPPPNTPLLDVRSVLPRDLVQGFSAHVGVEAGRIGAVDRIVAAGGVDIGIARLK